MPEASTPAETLKEPNPKRNISEAHLEDFEWLQYQDTGDQKSRITKALLNNPLVPLGAGATVVALVCGLYYMKQNNSIKQQFFMRMRVGAQGFTIASLLGGLFYESHMKEKELENMSSEAKMS